MSVILKIFEKRVNRLVPGVEVAKRKMKRPGWVSLSFKKGKTVVKAMFRPDCRINFYHKEQEVVDCRAHPIATLELGDAIDTVVETLH